MVDCDVAVIGAGVIGGSIAFELAARGASVTIIDQRGAGQGATRASAGMLVPFIEGFDHPVLGLGVRSLALYDEFIARVSRDSGIGVGYQRSGSLQVATSEDSIENLAATAAAAKRAGVRCSLLDAQEIRDAEPQITPDAVAGLLIDEHGFVAANELSGALVASAIKHGARVRTPERVERIAGHGGVVEVAMTTDHVRAAHAVLAAGSWSGKIDIAGARPLPVRPIRGQLLQLSSDLPPLRRVTWGSRCYLVPAGERTILVGATVEDVGFDERVTVAGVRDLLDAATDLVPGLWQQTFAEARVGLRPATPDELPIIGRSHVVPGLVYATGHFRNGVLLAPLTARLVADLVLEGVEDEVLASTSPQRFGDY
jgi:glycine oxidase